MSDQQMPSCPKCANNDRVLALEAPSSRNGRPLMDAPSSWPFECCRCVLLFRGTDAEWVRMTEDRRKYQADREKRSIPGGVR